MLFRNNIGTITMVIIQYEIFPNFSMSFFSWDPLKEALKEEIINTNGFECHIKKV